MLCLLNCFSQTQMLTDLHDELLSSPHMTIIWNDHWSVGGSDSRMRIKPSALPALSDCWKIKAVIRDWETSTVIFNGGSRLQTTNSVILWGLKWENCYCCLCSCVKKTLHLSAAVSHWDSTGSSSLLVRDRFGLIESNCSSRRGLVYFTEWRK